MSVNFNSNINNEVLDMLKSELGEPAGFDQRTVLYDDIATLNRERMGKIAKVAGQPVTIEANTIGEVKTMSDGTKYVVTSRGWKKITE